jgi:MFS family permease
LFFGWWVVFAAAATAFLTAGSFFYGFSTLFDPLTKEFGWSRASISVAFSLRSEVGGIAAIGVGFLVDRWGSRRLMAGGVVLVAIGFLLLSQAQTLWTFYGATVVIAVGGSAAGGQAGMVAVSHWFRRLRGRALGLMTMGTGASGAMAVVLAMLISSFGWRSALVIIGLTQLAVCVPLAMSIRDRPHLMGLTPDGTADPSSKTAEGLPAIPAVDGMSARQAFRSAGFWRLSGAVALANMGTTAVLVHQIPFFTSSVGLSASAAAASLTALTFTSLIGRFGTGYLSDIVDKRVTMASAYAITGVAILLYATIYEPWQILIVVPIFALGFGSAIPVRAAFQAEYFGMRSFGVVQGMIFTIATLGGVAGPILAGWMYDQTDSYRMAFVLFSGVTMVAAPLMLTVPRRPSAFL